MMEYLVAIVLIVLSLVVFRFFRGGSSPQSADKINTTSKKTPIEKENTVKTAAVPNEKIIDPKSFMINSFREGKDLIHPHITRDGKSILYHDEKRIFLCNLNSMREKNPKFLTKTVEQDVICDASYSQDKK